ncbi:hypothetical protein KCH_64030 [Kitasatospora cheerisanensis KCTC 2395]|uniref:Uncharacterized protein n=1 Tax=Kitasatospora cheerisanensis KCTC 2395 TaxID=1348663 RepID=A0A066YJR2_9ACTN|nr:hypothetical protein KCH_64030 [Kitasatospora cheerisanensis KCTC 2395]
MVEEVSGLTELSGGVAGPEALRPLVAQTLAALTAGAVRRGGPVIAGEPEAVTEAVRAALADAQGPGALGQLVELLAHGAADPADPACAAHLHCPPLAVAVAADLAVSALNPSQDSWDQAPPPPPWRANSSPNSPAPSASGPNVRPACSPPAAPSPT